MVQFLQPTGLHATLLLKWAFAKSAAALAEMLQFNLLELMCGTARLVSIMSIVVD